jgi:hypothetical protein
VGWQLLLRLVPIPRGEFRITVALSVCSGPGVTGRIPAAPVIVGPTRVDIATGAAAVTVGLARGRPERLVGGVNTPDARACSRVVAPGSAPGLRCSTSR